MAAGLGTSFSLSQNLSASAPTLSTDGQAIADLDAITVVVETATPASQTLSGGGTLLCYIYDDWMAKWSRCPDLDLSVTASAVARQAFQAVTCDGRRNGRVLWVPSAVTVSAGTTVTVYQLGYSKRVSYAP